MKPSPEFDDARVVIVGTPGSGRADLLHEIARRCGGPVPERLDCGAWSLLRTGLAWQGVRFDLCCVAGACAYHGVQSALVETADGVIVMFDVSPDRLFPSRSAFEALRPVLGRWGGPWLLQYHRIEKEPRFEAGSVDDWLKLEPRQRCGIATTSDAPDLPGGAFDRLVERLVARRVG